MLNPEDTTLEFQLRLITADCNRPARAATRLLEQLDAEGVLAHGSIRIPAGWSYVLGPGESGRQPCAVLCDHGVPLALIGRTHALPAHAHVRVAPILELRGWGECEVVLDALRQMEIATEQNTSSYDVMAHETFEMLAQMQA